MNCVSQANNHKCDKKITSQAICFSLICIMTFRYQSCDCLSNFRRVRRFRVDCLFRIKSVRFPKKAALKLFYESQEIQLGKQSVKKFDITFVLTNLCNNYLRKKFKSLKKFKNILCSYYYFTIQQKNSKTLLILINISPCL